VPKLMLGGFFVLLGIVFLVVSAASKGSKGGPLLRVFGIIGMVLGGVVAMTALMVVIDPGEVGVRHAFGTVDPVPLLPGIRMVAPWSEIERYSTREEQYPGDATQRETMEALSSEQMAMQVDAGLRWQIDPAAAPRIFTELGSEAQIHSAVLNAIRKGVRDGMVQYSINDISKRELIAQTMERLVDSALATRPRAGGPPFRIATVTAFFLRNLEPPEAVVTAINNKIAQEQQVETERHRVEVARLQAEQQRLLNTTLTPEALTKQYFDVLREMKNSNNLVIMVPTSGGMPLLDINALRANLRAH
jgi:regulator of protease activity HflC (stomatin/prohibitin superfamily)